jgi:hypothetical protein
MFSNFVKFRAASAAQAASRPFVRAHSNDNAKIVRVATGLRRRGRPILACHWRPTTSGRLECCWEVERANNTSAEEPDQRRMAVCGPFGFAYAA